MLHKPIELKNINKKINNFILTDENKIKMYCCSLLIYELKVVSNSDQ